MKWNGEKWAQTEDIHEHQRLQTPQILNQLTSKQCNLTNRVGIIKDEI